MSLNAADMEWEILAQRAQARLALLPEFNPGLPNLIGDLRAVRDLYAKTRLPDRKLLGIDLENLAIGLDSLAELRAKKPDLDTSSISSDLMTLLADMSARASHLLAQKVEALATHSAAAALGLTPVDPALAPAPKELDNSLTLEAHGTHAPLASTLLGASGLEARIKGPLLFAPLAEHHHGRMAHVSPDIFALPAGRMMTVEPNQAVILWGSKAEDPTLDTLRGPAWRIESQDQALEIYGPALLSRPLNPQPILAKNGCFAEPMPQRPSPAGGLIKMGAAFMIFLVSNLVGSLSDSSFIAASTAGSNLEKSFEDFYKISEMFSAIGTIVGILFFVSGIFALKASAKDNPENPSPEALRQVEENARKHGLAVLR